jgi:hypothetical protein
MIHEIAQVNGNLDAADDDLVEVSAGGKIIVAQRSTLMQMKGTRLEALFSGRWDKKLQRDSHGRIFLDVDPTCFQAIVDYLNEMLISSKDSPPSPHSVDDEHEQILQHQLELFGLVAKVEMPDSNIIKDQGHCIMLRGWLKEDVRMGTSFSFIEDLVMVYQVQHFTPSVTTRDVPSPSSKQLMAKSLGGIPTLPGQTVVCTVRLTRHSCFRSRAAAFRLRAK